MNIITRLHALQEDWLRMDADPDVDTSAYGTCAEDIGGLIAEYEDQPLASEPARTPTEDQLRRDIGADQLPPATVSPAPLSRAAFTARVEQALTWQVLERADVAKFDAFGANAARAAHISVLADALYPVLGAAMMTQLKQENTDEQKRTNEGEVSDLRREDAGARPVLGEAMPRLLKETVEGEVEEARRQRLGAASPVAGAPETGPTWAEHWRIVRSLEVALRDLAWNVPMRLREAHELAVKHLAPNDSDLPTTAELSGMWRDHECMPDGVLPTPPDDNRRRR
jgi:hypothetical protein